MDRIGAHTRSEIMRRVRAKGTAPELRVRKLVFSMGYRYRLHVRNLPGKPDLVFRKHKAIIFVHGCFWHSHKGCRRGSKPSSNVEFWIPKLERNVARDSEHQEALEKAGWRVLVLWECELGREDLTQRLKRFLE